MLMFKDHTGVEHDFDALPPASRVGIVGRGVSHVLGNEVASQVVGYVRRTIAESIGKGTKAETVTTEQVKAYRADHATELATKTNEYQATKMASIIDGTLGVHSGGTAADPLTRIMLSIARQEIKAILKKISVAFPEKEGTTNFAGKDLTADELVNGWLSGLDRAGTFGPVSGENKSRIEKLAQAELKRKADGAKRVANSTAGADDVIAGLKLN